MRKTAVVVLLVVAAVLGIIANVAIWANRTIFDTDEFVSTVNSVYSADEVQVALADRITTRIVEGGELELRIAEALPEGMQILAGPLVQGATELINRTALRVIQADFTSEFFQAALRSVHSQFIAILENESALGIDGNSIVLDVTQIIERVLTELGVQNPDSVLARLNLPEGSGQIVLVEDASTASTMHQLISLHNVATVAVLAAAVLFFAAAILISRRRATTARTVALIVLGIGVLGLLTLIPLRGLVAGLARDESVGRVVFDEMLKGYRYQSFLLIVLAIVAIVALFFFGGSRLATSARGAVKSSANREGLRTSMTESVMWLRAIGLVAAGFALVAWPDPGARLYVTVILLLAAYLVGLAIITSDAAWAQRARGRASNAWGRVSRPGDERGNWFARNAMKLRVGGVAVALLLLIVWPSLTFAAVAGFAALAFIYLAVVDYLAGRGSTDAEPDTAEAAPAPEAVTAPPAPPAPSAPSSVPPAPSAPVMTDSDESFPI